jgi:hypothetical protein
LPAEILKTLLKTKAILICNPEIRIFIFKEEIMQLAALVKT